MVGPVTSSGCALLAAPALLSGGFEIWRRRESPVAPTGNSGEAEQNDTLSSQADKPAIEDSFGQDHRNHEHGQVPQWFGLPWVRDNKYRVPVMAMSAVVQLAGAVLLCRACIRGRASSPSQQQQPNSTDDMIQGLLYSSMGRNTRDLQLEPSAQCKSVFWQESIFAKIVRIKRIIEGIGEQSPATIKPYLKNSAPFLAVPLALFLVGIYYTGRAVNQLHMLVKSLPGHILWATVGFMMCFFGGVFPATIAALEAWNQYDGCKSLGLCEDLYGEALMILAKSEEDDKKDENNNGVADVDECAPHKLFLRKTSLALRTMDAEKVSGAITGLCTAWVAVLATLKVQFARIAALGAAIGDSVYSIVAVTIEPSLKHLMPHEYDKWITVACRLTCKAWAIYLCWWIQRYVSAFHCAVRGGLMLGRELVSFLNQKGYITFTTKQHTWTR